MAAQIPIVQCPMSLSTSDQIDFNVSCYKIASLSPTELVQFIVGGTDSNVGFVEQSKNSSTKN